MCLVRERALASSLLCFLGYIYPQPNSDIRSELSLEKGTWEERSLGGGFIAPLLTCAPLLRLK